MKSELSEQKLKVLLKEAIAEVFEERKELIYDFIVEAIEDIALINAIKQGENTSSVSRKEIFKILNGEN
ncbi:MAG: hypothetical protein ACE5HO_17610 [bacterium]